MPVMQKFALQVVFTIFTISGAAFAADPLPASCGNASAQFKVKTEKATGAPIAPADQAMLVFIVKEDGDFPASPLARFAVDGKWVGAAKGESYIAVPVAPGAHSICVSRQTNQKLEQDNGGTSVVHSVAGNTYFYEFTVKREEIGFAQRANGGAGGAASPAGSGSTPDMTAKRHDTLDTATFFSLNDSEAAKDLHKLPVSTWLAK